MNIALVIIFAFLLLAVAMGIRAKKGHDMNLEQWTVGGRGFGAVFVFLLMAGEIYTTFTFLGGSAWAYGKGGPALYILGYMMLAYAISYYLLPAVWRYGKEKNLLSQSDFFASKYNSQALGIIVALVGVLAIVPYIILQFKGLGIIVSQASYGTISPTLAIWIGAIAVTVYVMISGIHGSAWTAVLKDIMILILVMIIGLYLPFHYYGGIQPMFEAIDKAHPNFVTIPKQGLSISWFISTVLLTSLGFYMWPHTFGSAFSAKSEKVFRKNAAISPIYAMLLLFVFFVGFAAILQVKGLEGADQDLSLLKLSIKTFDPWVVGFIGAAGLLTALVPGSMLLMSAATLLARNVYKPFAKNATDNQIMKLAKYLVPVISLLSVYLTLNGGNTIVVLLLMGYSFVTQLFPALIASLMKNNFVTKQGAMVGIIVGELTVLYVTITSSTVGTLFPSLPQMVKDLNVGIIALILNIVAMTIVSVVTQKYSIPLAKKEATDLE
ncbi:sodium:solute symporter family protein [Neobacillus terrae]|uniref:sodium:solute symporter family protein n=1 Tax=Neobacillus terrae TaxID=3034837 RepID=UPI00140A548E|nr:sodium:solute symporter [Neobacillus terrae]NHM30693.1 sodium:solute symporter [Neobacillus terrae]